MNFFLVFTHFKTFLKFCREVLKKNLKSEEKYKPNTDYVKSDSIIIERDNNTMKTKLIVGSEINALRFDEKSFFSTILGLTPYWDFKSHNEYVGEKIIYLSTIDKTQLKCDVIDGSLLNGVRQTTLYSFVLDKLPGYKVFSEPETINYKKINKSVLNTIPFYLEDDNNEEVNFNGETLTFTLQMIKI